MTRNTMKAKIQPSGNVQLKLERRDAWGRIRERMTFTIGRRQLERALAEATIEAPWRELLQKIGRR